MIKDVFVLRKSSWHMKLMKWIWNLDYRDFSHICPYFWMSVANVIIVPIVAFFRGLVWLLKHTIDWIIDAIEACVENRYQRWVDSIKDNPDEFLSKSAKLCKKDYNEISNLLFDYNRFPDPVQRLKYYEKLVEARREWEAQRVAKESRGSLRSAQAALTRKQRINTVVKYVKPVAVTIGWGLMIALAIVILFLLWKLIVVISTVPAKSWKTFGLVVIGFLAGALIVLGLFAFLRWAVTRIACSVPSETPGWVKAIGIPFKWLFTGIATLWDIVTTMASNSCPFIDWED